MPHKEEMSHRRHTDDGKFAPKSKEGGGGGEGRMSHRTKIKMSIWRNTDDGKFAPKPKEGGGCASIMIAAISLIGMGMCFLLLMRG